MRSYVPWYVAVLVAAMVAVPRAQQGQGANISSNDATAVLRRGPLSRVPGEAVAFQATMPEKFPKDLLPEGSEVVAASVSASLSVVVATIPSKDTFEFTKYQWKLEELGWTNSGGTRFGFTMSGMSGGNTARRLPERWRVRPDFIGDGAEWSSLHQDWSWS